MSFSANGYGYFISLFRSLATNTQWNWFCIMSLSFLLSTFWHNIKDQLRKFDSRIFVLCTALSVFWLEITSVINAQKSSYYHKLFLIPKISKTIIKKAEVSRFYLKTDTVVFVQSLKNIFHLFSSCKMKIYSITEMITQPSFS